MRYDDCHGTEHEDITFEPEDMFRVCCAQQRQRRSEHGFDPTYTEYKKFHENITIRVVVELQIINEIFRRQCPQFRILVIGKTGVGKSSLINHAFGVQNATALHDKPGEASIDHEFTSPQNNRFILHDSKGFEPGESNNLKVVLDFIDRQRAMPYLKDKLHAIWLCVEIPRAGERLLEIGVEQFLTSKCKGELGNIPIVVVFTKYDTLLDRVERTLDKSSLKGLSKEAIEELTKKSAQDEIQEVCIIPLERFVGSHIPQVTVSTSGNHEDTLVYLFQTTEVLICKHIETAPVLKSYQGTHPGLKMVASIQVAERRYWRVLGSIVFNNRSMWDCLHVLHTDIVKVWNFHDPYRYLDSPEFRTLMRNMVNQRSRTGLQRFMIYFMDLILVLQILYLVTGNQELSSGRTIMLAVNCYHGSPMSGEISNRIREYNMRLIFRKHAYRNSLDQLVTLSQSYNISAEEILRLRGNLPAVNLLSDEPWGTIENS
jgi:GTPase SAR1 family protein